MNLTADRAEDAHAGSGGRAAAGLTTLAPGAWRTAVILAFTALISYTDRFILNILAPSIEAELRLSDTQMGVLIGLGFAIVFAVAGVLLGRLADISNRRNLIVYGMLVWTAGTLCCGLSPNYGSLLASRTMVAIGEAVLIPAGYSMLADLFPPSSRGTAIGLFVMGTTLGNAVSLLVGGGLLHATTRGVLAGLPPMLGFSPWRTTILLISLPGFAMAAVLCTIKEAIRRDRFAGPRASLRHFASLALADHARLTALYLAIALFSMADFGLTVWKPTLFVRHFRLSTGELGLILGTIAAVSSTVGALVGGRVADRGAEPRRRATFAALIGACIAAITVVIAAPNVLLVLSGIAIWSFGWAAVSVIAVTTLQELLPNEYRGIGSALIGICGILFGVGLGPTLVAVCTDYLYRDPQLIGWSIVTIMFPAATLGALSLRHVSRHC